jgi:type I restriction enzyme R subunit
LFVDLFPGRTEVPKTLVFCKDDSHAEDVVDILREEFGRGNSFAQKITYKTTGKRPADLLQEFRISYEPRVAVTVDMVSTGTDIRSIEIVLFLRSIKSRVLFEQMKGRGVRIIDANELRAVTPDATAKTHFVLVDAVGLTDHADFTDTHPLECQKHVSTRALLDYVAMGGTAPDALSSLASRLARLGRVLDHDAHRRLEAVSGGVSLWDLCRGILEALDLDRQVEAARCRFYGSSVDAASRRVDPTEAEITMAAEALAKAAVAPLASNPGLRQLILELKARLDQVLDEVSKDELVFAGASQEAKDKARSLVTSFEAFLAGHRDEIDALQFFYSQPYSKRLRYTDVKGEGVGRGDPGPAPVVDPGGALAGLRVAGKGQGARGVGPPTADRHRVPRALRAAPAAGAGAVRGAGAGAVPELDGRAGDAGEAVHARAGPVAGDDEGSCGSERRDRGRGFRPESVCAGGGAGGGGTGVWG